MSHTWLPSHTGPTLLITSRRSSSSFDTTGSSMAMPRSKPSITMKPTNMNSTSPHQMSFRVS